MSKSYLGKTAIEYGDRNWNFYPGCLHKPQGKCPVPNCWAEAMTKRKQEDFHKPHLIPELLLAPLRVKKPSTILVNFMGDLGGDWVDPDMIVHRNQGDIITVLHLDTPDGIVFTLRDEVFQIIKECPQHRFLFLSKSPGNWQKWGAWPDNTWVGASVWSQDSFIDAIYHPNGGLRYLKAKHKWLSIEPLLGEIKVQVQHLKGFDWVVIGGQTRPDIMPKIEWVEEIVKACDAAGVKVWLKNNLKSLVSLYNEEVCNKCEAGDPCGICGSVIKWRQERQRDFTIVEKVNKNESS